jgi:hypothetical protein
MGDLRTTWEEARHSCHTDLADIQRVYMCQSFYVISCVGEYIGVHQWGLHLCEEFKAGLALITEKPAADKLLPDSDFRKAMLGIQHFLCVLVENIFFN